MANLRQRKPAQKRSSRPRIELVDTPRIPKPSITSTEEDTTIGQSGLSENGVMLRLKTGLDFTRDTVAITPPDKYATTQGQISLNYCLMFIKLYCRAV